MKPSLIINQDVYDEIMYYVNRSQYEVSGMGKVVVEPGGVLRVVSQIMLPQKNRSTHTQVEPEDINKLLFEMGESPRFWWHSHVKMGVFWSGEDMDTIKVNAGPEGWFVNTVFNQDAKTKSAYFSAKGLVTPWGNDPVWYDDIETKIERPNNKEREAEWEATYLKNVTNLSYHSAYSYNTQSGRIAALGENLRTGGNAGPTGFDPASEPPKTRPPGMSKRLYKMWKTTWRVKVKLGEKEQRDVYGFDEAERKTLAENGYSDKDVDDLVAEDFSPKEIVEIAASGTTTQEIAHYLAMHMSVEDTMTLVRHNARLDEGHDVASRIQ